MVRLFTIRAFMPLVAALLVGWQPAAAQTPIEARGPYRHVAADAIFPERVGGFVRDTLYQYDAEGRDVSASYNLATPEGRLLLTVYIYPALQAGATDGSRGGKAARAQLCALEHGAVKQAIANHVPGASPSDEDGGIAVRGVEASLSHRSIYRYRIRFDDREQEVRSEAHLYCFVKGKWLVKYRVTTPAAVDGRNAIDAFIRGGPWPGRTPMESTVQREAPPASGG